MSSQDCETGHYPTFRLPPPTFNGNAGPLERGDGVFSPSLYLIIIINTQISTFPNIASLSSSCSYRLHRNHGTPTTYCQVGHHGYRLDRREYVRSTRRRYSRQ